VLTTESLNAVPGPAGSVPPRPLAIAQGLIDHAAGVGGEAATHMLLAAATIKAMAAERAIRCGTSELTAETLNRLEAAARKQSGLEFGTTIATMPGELLELVRGYRESLSKQTSSDDPS
jgi:hypothetical protein